MVEHLVRRDVEKEFDEQITERARVEKSDDVRVKSCRDLREQVGSESRM